MHCSSMTEIIYALAIACHGDESVLPLACACMTSDTEVRDEGFIRSCCSSQRLVSRCHSVCIAVVVTIVLPRQYPLALSPWAERVPLTVFINFYLISPLLCDDVMKAGRTGG